MAYPWPSTSSIRCASPSSEGTPRVDHPLQPDRHTRHAADSIGAFTCSRQCPLRELAPASGRKTFQLDYQAAPGWRHRPERPHLQPARAQYNLPAHRGGELHRGRHQPLPPGPWLRLRLPSRQTASSSSTTTRRWSPTTWRDWLQRGHLDPRREAGPLPDELWQLRPRD